MSHLSLVLFSAIFVTSAAAAVLKNYTITVPGGASNHNDPHLLCTPTGWQDIITFYLGNYIAHVATVISLPGESTSATIRVSLASLFFPISGLMRGLSTILTFASFAKTDLKKAAQAGALCMVVRNQDWKPEPGDSITDSYLEETSKATEGTNKGSPNNSVRVRVFDAPWSTIRTVDYTLVVVNPGFTIHGSIHIPVSKGYELAYVSGDAEFEDDFAPQMSARTSTWSWGISSVNKSISSTISSPAAPTTISSSYNMIGGLIALAQAIYTSVTLYQTRGDQIKQYGCAAFGLTVAPFVMMSTINLIGNIFAPSYSAIYMIETSVMVEARRHGCHFDGVVGKLRKGRGAELISAIDEVKWVDSVTFKNDEANHLTVDIARSTGTDPQTPPTQIMVEERDNIEPSASAEKRVMVDEQQNECRKYIIQDKTESKNPGSVIAIPSCPIIGSPYGKYQLRPRNRRWGFYVGRIAVRILIPQRTYSILRQGRGILRDMPTAEDPNPGPVHIGPPDRFTITTSKAGSELTIACGRGNYIPATNSLFLWGCFWD